MELCQPTTGSAYRKPYRQRERHRLLRIIKKCPVIPPHMSVKKGTDEDEESGASARE